jgi:catechol 2,3-dioxygenase-like lactoylglutathione lyase family enzyme
MHLKYAGIRVTDMDRALRFYVGFLRLDVERQGSQKGEWTLLRDPRSGQRLELNWYPPESPFATPYVPGEGLDHLGFEVDDARAWHAKALAAGAGNALDPFEDGPGNWAAYVTDPDGNWIELFSFPGSGSVAPKRGPRRPVAMGLGLGMLGPGLLAAAVGALVLSGPGTVSGFRDPLDAAAAQAILTAILSTFGLWLLGFGVAVALLGVGLALWGYGGGAASEPVAERVLRV